MVLILQCQHGALEPYTLGTNEIDCVTFPNSLVEHRKWTSPKYRLLSSIGSSHLSSTGSILNEYCGLLSKLREVCQHITQMKYSKPGNFLHAYLKRKIMSIICLDSFVILPFKTPASSHLA